MTIHLQYRADIDGLRAIAVAVVVAFHAFPQWLPGGFIGVDIFFVISGYLITGLIVAGIDAGRFSFIDFYARRARRIFPALALVLIACLAAGWLCLSPDEYQRLGRHGVAGAAFVSNFVLAAESGYFDPGAEFKPLLHLWSLGIEEQFYLCWPVLLWLGARGASRQRGRVLLYLCIGVTVASFAFGARVALEDPVAAFYSPFARFWELAAGAMLAVAQRRGAPAIGAASGWRRAGDLLSVAGLGAIALDLALIHTGQGVFALWSLLAVAGTCALIAAGDGAWVNRMLGTRLPVGIGRISYPLYLWHWPLLVFARLLDDGQPDPSVRLALVLLAIVLAHLTYVLIERPARFVFGLHRSAVGAALALGVVACAAFAINVQAGLPGRYPAGVAALLVPESRVEHAAYGRSGICHTEHGGARPPLCVEARRPLVLVFGDSHADSLYIGLRRMQEQEWRSFGLAQFTASGCPPFHDFSRANGPYCEDTYAQALAAVARVHPDTVLLGAFWTRVEYGLYDLQSGVLDTAPLLATVRALRAAGASRIVLLGPLPTWQNDLPRLLFLEYTRNPQHLLPPLRQTRFLRPGLWQVDDTLRRLAAAEGLGYLSPASVLCNREGCLTRMEGDGGKPTAIDYGHLSAPAAAYVVEQSASVIFADGKR